MKRHSVHLDFLIFRLSSSCCSIFGLSFPFPSSFSRLGPWELRCACMLYYARTAPSIKARRAFTRVLVAFTVSEKRPTKVCGTRELRYMTKLCVCMSDFPSLEIYFVNTKQGENTIFVRKKKY